MAERMARIARHLLAGAIAALATAAVHLLVVTFSRNVLGSFSWSWSSRDLVWIVPLGYLTVYAFISVPVAILAALLPNGIGARATIWLWTTVTTFAALLLTRRVFGVALLILALAVGYQVSRMAVQRLAATRRFATRGGLALAAVMAVLIAVGAGRRALQTRQELAAQPSPPSDAWNILLIVWDTARARNFSLHGYGRETTPFLDSLAAHAVVFDRAFVTAPWTLPSHASMLTGHYASTQSGDWLSPMDRSHRTIAEELRDRGYATGGFVANWLAAAYSTGLARGFTHYEDTQRSLEEVLLNTTLTQSAVVHQVRARLGERWYGGAARALLRFRWRPISAYQEHSWKPGAKVTDAFLRWQRRLDRPFFALLNYTEPHDPHRTPNRDRFNGGAKLIDRYDAALWTLDGEVRRIFAALERAGQLERTIVVVTSDHGEQFGEHGLNGHGNSLYLPLLHVPLVIYAANHPAAGRRVGHAVSLRDLPRTLLELAAVRDVAFPGIALLPRDTSRSASVSPSPAISEVSAGINDQPKNPTNYGDLLAVTNDTLHVIRHAVGKYEVFAHERDATESENLAYEAERSKWAREYTDAMIRQFGLRPPNARVSRENWP